jgi:hypothetical protein
MELSPIELIPVGSLFDQFLQVELMYSENPLTFEQLKLRHGFVLYSTIVNINLSDSAILNLNGLKDRAQVFVDNVRYFYNTLDINFNKFDIF